jgi:hypothetical protein
MGWDAMDSTLPFGVTDGRQAFTDAIRALLLQLPESAPREVWMIDSTFDSWPLDEPAVLDALGAWLRPAGRQLNIVANDFSAVQQRFPRFAAWRRLRVHAIAAWQPTPEDNVQLTAQLLAESAAVELLDVARWRARQVSSRSDLRSLNENAGTLLRRCQTAWPATTVGL